MKKEQLYVVRLWDGMDGVWMDVSESAPLEEATRIYNEKTAGGTKMICYKDIDYYNIFPANTTMRFSYEAGCDGMFRDGATEIESEKEKDDD